jgi:nitrite reductase/ring-hydroxylating ferredoxin subunit
VTFGGHPFRIIALDDELIAHSTVCPHWLGPLDAATPDELGCIRCPWHGYGFDVRSGHSTDGRNLQLAPAPRVAIDPISGTVSLLHAHDDDAEPHRLT